MTGSGLNLKLNFFDFVLNLDSLHVRLISHYKAYCYKTKKPKKIKAYRRSV